MVTPSSIQPNPDQIRKSLRSFVGSYLSARQPDKCVGEFLDSQGLGFEQLGLAGTCLVFDMAKRAKFDHDTTEKSSLTLASALNKTSQDRSETEDKLVKDYGFIAAKTAIMLFWSVYKDPKVTEKTLDHLLKGVARNGLIRPVLNDEAVNGDSFVTAYVLHVIHLSRCELDEDKKVVVNSIVHKLRADLANNIYPLMKRLLISSAICLFNFDDSISDHRRNLKQLFLEKESFKRVIASDSLFVDHWYSDTGEGSSRTRYLRIPKGYVILASLYIALGRGSDFFNFPLVRSILSEIGTSFSHFVEGDRSRSAVYFVFFLHAALCPSEYFSVKKSPFWMRWSLFITYSFGELTIFGRGLLFLVPFAIFLAFFVSIEKISGNGSWIDVLSAWGFLLATALGLLRVKAK